jgi:hypothetical protein
MSASMKKKAHDYDDWAAVSAAIIDRMRELGLKDRDIVQRSGQSKANFREIKRNTAQRDRNAPTLENISRALDWHPQHLLHVALGKEPPSLDDAPDSSILVYLDHQYREIVERLDGLDARFVSLDARFVSLVDNLSSGEHERRLPP